MPYLALNEFDEEITSFQCRDEYVRSETVYAAFRCPYCDVAYYSKNVYKDGVVGKAPHFSLYPGSTHSGNCDGEAADLPDALTVDAPAGKVEKREFELPEKLVARRPDRATRRLTALERVPPDEAEILRRRQQASKQQTPSRFTSSLLQNFVDGKKKLVRECFKKARDAGLDPAAEKALLKQIVSSYPLDLFGQQLNYDNAFWGAVNARGDLAARIFHGERASVAFTADGFEIATDPPAPGPAKVRAIVRFTQHGTAEAMPRAHARLLDTLRQAVTVKKWYAYGTLEKSDLSDVRILTLASLDFLHIEP